MIDVRKRASRLIIPGLVLGLVAVLGIDSGRTDDAPSRQVTFTKDVAPILQASCQECHRPGDIAPMSLLSYQDARPWAKSMKKAVAERSMPPWFADPAHGTFSNDVSLSEDDIRTIVAWVDQGAREGDPADMPEPNFLAADAWRLGEPDVIFMPDEPYTVGAEVEDEYRCFVIANPLEEDVWMVAQQQRPGNAAVVHHIMTYLDTTGTSRKLDEADPAPGFLCGMGSGAQLGGLDALFGGWAPGNRPSMYDRGIGKLIPAGADIVYQIHYHNTTGEDQTDQSAMGVYLARNTIQKTTKIGLSGAWVLDIPAGENNVEHKGLWRAKKDITISSLMPHMHFIGKDMSAMAIFPDGREQMLLSVPNYDFNWQITYIPEEPIKLPAGTEIRMISHHDNSAENPYNPFDPPQDMVWGEATNEEMSHMWFTYTVDDEELGIIPKDPALIKRSDRPDKEVSMN